MILLTGITGTTGSKVLNVLADKGIAMRAMVRDPAKVSDISVPDLEIVQGDFEDSGSMEKAMDGVDVAFMLMSNCPQQLENEIRFIDSAKATGVSTVVKLSATGADSSSHALLKSIHGKSEEYLAQSGLAYTSVRPNFYMQNMLHSAGSIVPESKFFLPMGQGRVGAIDVQDVAEFIAAVLTGEGHNGKTYLVTGGEILSFADMATQMSEVLGREIAYIPVSREDFAAQMRQFGTDDWYVDAVGDLFEIISRDGGSDLNDTFEQVCGRKPTLFREFVKQHAAVFSQ